MGDQKKNLGLYNTYIKVVKKIFYLCLLNKMASCQYKKKKKFFLRIKTVYIVAVLVCHLEQKKKSFLNLQ